jgi:hypothetical protein
MLQSGRPEGSEISDATRVISTTRSLASLSFFPVTHSLLPLSLVHVARGDPWSQTLRAGADRGGSCIGRYA